MRIGPYREGHGAEPARRAEGQAPTEAPGRVASESSGRAKDKAEDEGEDEAPGRTQETDAMMYVEFVKVLTVLLVITMIVAVWPPSEDD